uniref:Uncharacterized protein n=1 Tax=Anguilla anguilla TaxID=7936 RepID=A0A0E9T3E9_ANGAN
MPHFKETHLVWRIWFTQINSPILWPG